MFVCEYNVASVLLCFFFSDLQIGHHVCDTVCPMSHISVQRLARLEEAAIDGPQREQRNQMFGPCQVQGNMWYVSSHDLRNSHGMRS